MKYLDSLRVILVKRLAQDPPFEVTIGTNAQRFFQASIKAIHRDCIELADGTYIMIDKIVTLKISD